MLRRVVVGQNLFVSSACDDLGINPEQLEGYIQIILEILDQNAARDDPVAPG